MVRYGKNNTLAICVNLEMHCNKNWLKIFILCISCNKKQTNKKQVACSDILIKACFLCYRIEVSLILTRKKQQNILWPVFMRKNVIKIWFYVNNVFLPSVRMPFCSMLIVVVHKPLQYQNKIFPRKELYSFFSYMNILIFQNGHTELPTGHHLNQEGLFCICVSLSMTYATECICSSIVILRRPYPRVTFICNSNLHTYWLIHTLSPVWLYNAGCNHTIFIQIWYHYHV